MRDTILGEHFMLSLVFVGAQRAQALNQEHRGKDYVPNVLSFPLDSNSGEIYICPTVARQEAPKFGLTPRGYIGYLFIHGLLHLKGYKHSPKMERLEKKYLKKFQLN